MGRPKGSTNKSNEKVKAKTVVKSNTEQTSKVVASLAAKGLIGGRKAVTEAEFKSICGCALTQSADTAGGALRVIMGVLTANADEPEAPKKRRKRRAKAANGHDEVETDESDEDEETAADTAESVTETLS